MKKGIDWTPSFNNISLFFSLLSPSSPISLPCSLCWVKNGLLLVGRGHIVKVQSHKLIIN